MAIETIGQQLPPAGREAGSERLPGEALRFAGSLRRLGGERDLAACARALADHGCEYVLITGTHLAGAEVVNTLYDESGVVREDRWPRLPHEYHGSGCTLASAIAAYLARGLEPPQAVGEAQRFTWQALAAGFAAGRGQLLPNRLCGR